MSGPAGRADDPLPKRGKTQAPYPPRQARKPLGSVEAPVLQPGGLT